MADIEITPTSLIVHIQGADRFLALKSHVEVPLEHIAGVDASAPEAHDFWHGMKVAGSNIPGVVTAGRFVQGGEWDFWDVHDPDKAIVVRLQRGGFQVMLRPLLDEASLKDSWRGLIAPSSTSKWFAHYRKAIVALAALGQRLGVAQLDVGTELSSLQGDASQWGALISAVRRVYSGCLVYSCNWNAVTPEPWFNRLDAIGVDAYFPVQLPVTASTAQIAAVLHEDLVQLPDLPRPIWITEIGTAPVAGSFRAPYVQGWTGLYYPQAQASYYQAVCLARPAGVQGLFWWVQDLGPAAKTASSFDTTPQAGQVVEQCFKAATRTQAAAAARQARGNGY